MTRSFDVFFDLRLNKRLSKQSWGWWLETLSRPLWRHRNALIIWRSTKVIIPYSADDAHMYCHSIKCLSNDHSSFWKMWLRQWSVKIGLTGLTSGKVLRTYFLMSSLIWHEIIMGLNMVPKYLGPYFTTDDFRLQVILLQIMSMAVKWHRLCVGPSVSHQKGIIQGLPGHSYPTK